MILWHFLNHPASLKQIPPHVIFGWQKSIFCEEAPQNQCPAKPCECHFLTTWHRGKKWPDYTLRFVMGLLQCQPNPAKLLDSMSWKTTWISSKWYQMYEMPTSWLNPQRYIFCISCLFVLFDSSGALRACCTNCQLSVNPWMVWGATYMSCSIWWEFFHDEFFLRYRTQADRFREADDCFKSCKTETLQAVEAEHPTKIPEVG